ncbi:MAG: prepilin-type N-terminal cleavage/methylation domain-containing protein [Candidatus Sericytochromatia bacterium]|nr:prepilin-type N-terminal cleavage/methylation domain-containing protein [Candidatus Sericytochromatia bacterium]
MRRGGFTLPELLIAAAVGSLVLGLSVTAFSEIARAIAASRSRFEAQRLATSAVGQVGEVVRRGHVFYHSARPLKAQTAIVTGRTGEHATRAALPPPLVNLGEVSVALRPPTTDAGLADPEAWLASTVSKRRFRFTFPDDDPSGGGNPAFALSVAPGKRTGDPYHDRFPGPLAYFAVAEFRKTLTGDASNPTALLPRSWTFHVLYVAPMNLRRNDANFAVPNNPRDQLAPPIKAGENANRTAVPYELRLLTIPDVCAGAISPPGGAYNVQTVDTTLAAHQAEYDPEGRRILAPGAPPGTDAAFLQPPFDYDGRTANGRANYDPVPIPMTDPPAAAYDEASLAAIFRFALPDGTRTGRPASGARIVGEGRHANFGVVGNDPPTQEALANRIPPQFAAEAGGTPAIRPITDKLVMPYVDPDTVAGTSVRFVNNLHEPTGAPDANGVITLPGGATYHRYVETIGPGCDYFENRVQSLTGTTGADTNLGALGVRPARILVSMSVRYRSRRDIPFQFATVQSEIPLDGLDQFAKVRPLP